jgi:hypothetical protein
VRDELLSASKKTWRRLRCSIHRRYINSLHLTGWSLPLIKNLSHDADIFRQVNSGVMPLRIKTEVELNEMEQKVYRNS